MLKLSYILFRTILKVSAPTVHIVSHDTFCIVHFDMYRSGRYKSIWLSTHTAMFSGAAWHRGAKTVSLPPNQVWTAVYGMRFRNLRHTFSYRCFCVVPQVCTYGSQQFSVLQIELRVSSGVIRIAAALLLTACMHNSPIVFWPRSIMATVISPTIAVKSMRRNIRLRPIFLAVWWLFIFLRLLHCSFCPPTSEITRSYGTESSQQ